MMSVSVKEEESGPSTRVHPSRASSVHDHDHDHARAPAAGLSSTADLEAGEESKKLTSERRKEEIALKLTDQTNLLPFRKVVSVFAGLAVCLLVSALDMTLIATALPSIATHFHAGKHFCLVFSALQLCLHVEQGLSRRSCRQHTYSPPRPFNPSMDASRTSSVARSRCVSR